MDEADLLVAAKRRKLISFIEQQEELRYSLDDKPSSAAMRAKMFERLWYDALDELHAAYKVIAEMSRPEYSPDELQEAFLRMYRNRINALEAKVEELSGGKINNISPE